MEILDKINKDYYYYKTIFRFYKFEIKNELKMKHLS